MKKFFIICLVFVSNYFAQDAISFDFDYARFKYDSTQTYLEIYYSLGQGNLTPYQVDDKHYIGAYLNISLRDTLINNEIMRKRYKSETEIDTSNLDYYKNKNLMGNLGYAVPSGKYELAITVLDIADTTRSVEFKEVIQVTGYPLRDYSISDIQLATRIITDSKNTSSIFYKNTLEVFPNPHDFYTEVMPVLFFYSELYNIDKSKSEGANVILVQQLLDNYGKALETKQKIIPSNNNSIVEAGVVNLKKYPTGAYVLRLSLFQDSINIGIASSKRFYLVNPSVAAPTQVTMTNMDVNSSEFGIYSEEECDNMFEVITPISAEPEIDTYEKLGTLDAKREFLFNFWKIRDFEPETPRNEFRDEYMERVNFVEARYKTFTKRGVKTDRGRVYLINGEPDEVDYHPNDYNTKPYESWEYHSIEGGVVFIFGDITGYNDYELLHSTKRGELRDDNWQRRIVVD